MCPPSLQSILVCKISQFWAKAINSVKHHTFLETSHPEVIKNPYYVLFPEWSQKVSTHGLNRECSVQETLYHILPEERFQV